LEIYISQGSVATQ